MRASDFLASFGVCIHMDAVQTRYGDPHAVAAALGYAGLSLVRDMAYDIDVPADLVLAASGVRFDLIVDENPASAVADMIPLGKSVAFFEGANEINMQPVPGVEGVAGAVALQRNLLAAVRNTPAFASVPVIDSSLGGATPDDFLAYSGTTAYATYANLHTYAPDGVTPHEVIPYALGGVAPAPGQATIITETGYYTLPNDSAWGGVSEAVQARLTLDTLLDNFKAGVPRTFLYELYDEGADPAGTDREMHFGLFRADGTPKPAATALHNLTTILAGAGPGGNAAASLPGLTISGLPDTDMQVVLTRDARTVDVVVWAEPRIWDAAAHTAIQPDAAAVTIGLGQTVQTVRVFDPLTGTAPVATYQNLATVQVAVTDHPLIIEAELAPAAFIFSGSGAVQAGETDGEAYAGPVDYLQRQYIWPGSDGASLAATIPNVFLHGGPGDDALQVSGGQNVLDGGTGSNFLVGGTGRDGGTDTFFVDGRGGGTTWSTVVNFHRGDAVTLFGFKPGVSTLDWAGTEGAQGYQGLTLHSALAGGGTAVTASLTLAGRSAGDLSTRIALTSGEVGGTPYLQLTAVA